MKRILRSVCAFLPGCGTSFPVGLTELGIIALGVVWIAAAPVSFGAEPDVEARPPEERRGAPVADTGRSRTDSQDGVDSSRVALPDDQGANGRGNPSTPTHVGEARLFRPASSAPGVSVVLWDRVAVRAAVGQRTGFTVERFPLSSDLAVDLELEPFWVAGPDTQFVVGRKGQPDRRLDFDPSSIALFRGQVRGRAGSHVYLALS